VGWIIAYRASQLNQEFSMPASESWNSLI
jgi:hypothetical protein